MVVVFHYAVFVSGNPPRLLLAPMAAAVNFGWAGVDLFFILSGFLIGGILLDARESANYFQVFYSRRICRIFPIYFTFLAIYFLFAARFSRLVDLPDAFHLPIPWATYATFTQNFWMAVRNNWGENPLAPTWSLAVEEQFYLTLPALIYFVKPAKLKWVLAGGIVLAPLVRLAIFLVNPALPIAMAFLLPCRMDSLLFGVAAAYFLRRPGALEYVRIHRRQMWSVLELLTVACALFLFHFSSSMYSPAMTLVGYDLLGLMFAAVLVAALVEESFARILQAKWLMSLGAISYGVYLIHPLTFDIAQVLLKRFTNSPLVSGTVGLILTIAIAKCSWEYFEKPIVSFGHRKRYEPARAGNSAGEASVISSVTLADPSDR